MSKAGLARPSIISKVKVTQPCPTLCHPMDNIVHGILQARILEWVAVPFFRGSSQPRDRTNPGLPHCRWILYQLSQQGSPRILEWVAVPFSRGYSWPRNRTRSPALQADSTAELPNQPKSHRKKEQHPSYANVDSRQVPKTPFFPVKLSSLLGLLFFRNFAVASVKIWVCSLMSTTMFTWKKGHDVEKEGTNICTNQLILRPHDFIQACQRPTPPSYISTPDIFPVFKTVCFPPCWHWYLDV